DATNVTALGVKVITSVDLDHMRYLGSTLPEIAAEKAGIVRENDLVVCGHLAPEALAVVERRCAEAGAEMWLADRDFDTSVRGADWEGVRFDFTAREGSALHSISRLTSVMVGRHQATNAGLAVAAAQAMVGRHGIAIDDRAVRDGVAATRWPGRLERIPGHPRVVVDGAHNPAAITALIAAIKDLEPSRQPVLLFGAMADKDVAAMVRLLPGDWPAVFTAVAEERAIPGRELMQIAADSGRTGDAEVADVGAALEAARERAGAGGLVLVLGSLYLAGDVRRRLVGADT
ncbi:MAG TPA: cyanophycin synthetase, partial [Candidatus Dormibacteraeota bacterium]|nr:cyanophycin synthetase [Candidatus Dormibacteraeota bacterium]